MPQHGSRPGVLCTPTPSINIQWSRPRHPTLERNSMSTTDETIDLKTTEQEYQQRSARIQNAIDALTE